MRSHRWLTTDKVDIDAYLLTSGEWMLFAYLKSEALVRADAEHWRKIAADFKQGEVAIVARAAKTEKGSEPLDPISIEGKEIPDEVWAREDWLRYRLEPRSVLNPGLFLDQTANRMRLMERIQNAYAEKSLRPEDAFLNLFSYTGSFTIAAISAGVRSTTSVDVSSRYLSWEKQNFEANFGGLEVEHRLINDDARDFLRRAAKRGSVFRWIVIDPPTFSRGQKKRFQVQEELFPMCEEALSCLAPGGAMLVSTNDARWDARTFHAKVDELARDNGLIFERGLVTPGFGASHPLKSAWLVKSVST